MGYVILHIPSGPVTLGDDRGQQQAKKADGLPYRRVDGSYVSEEQLRKMDEVGS